MATIFLEHSQSLRYTVEKLWRINKGKTHIFLRICMYIGVEETSEFFQINRWN